MRRRLEKLNVVLFLLGSVFQDVDIGGISDGNATECNGEMVKFSLAGGSYCLALVLCYRGGTVVSTAALQLQGPGFVSRLGSLSVWSLHILPVSAWVSSGFSGFLPQSQRCAA